MTRMDEVIQQIETVIDDREYPATLGELMAMKRILDAVARRYAPLAGPVLHPSAQPQDAHRYFPGGVYNVLRDYERRRHAPSLVRPVPAAPCGSL